MRHGTPEGKTAIQCTYTYTLALITKNPSGGRWDKKKTTENSRTKVLTYLHMFVLFWLTAITLYTFRGVNRFAFIFLWKAQYSL